MDLPFPEPDAVFAGRNYWNNRTVRVYVAKIANLSEPEPRPDDEEFVNSTQVRKLFGGVSLMWIWRKRKRKAKPAIETSREQEARDARAE